MGSSSAGGQGVARPGQQVSIPSAARVPAARLVLCLQEGENRV